MRNVTLICITLVQQLLLVHKFVRADGVFAWSDGLLSSIIIFKLQKEVIMSQVLDHALHLKSEIECLHGVLSGEGWYFFAQLFIFAYGDNFVENVLNCRIGFKELIK